MKPIKMNSLFAAGFAVSISLFGTSVYAQVNGGTQTPPAQRPNGGIVGVVDGSIVTEGSKSVTMEDLMKSVEQDLQSQGVAPGSPMRPASRRYLLTFGDRITREFIYVNAEKGTIRWEDRTDLLTFSPANLPEQILATMMKAGRLVKLTTPTSDSYANALDAELKTIGVNVESPETKEVHVKLGFRYNKLSLNFSAKDGILEWAYVGTPFMKGNYAEGMLRALQARGMFKAADGTPMIIMHGADKMKDEEKIDTMKDKDDSALDAKTPPKKPTKAGDQKVATKTDAPAATTPAPMKIILSYSVATDQNDYSDNSDVGVSVKGMGKATQGNTPGSADGVIGGTGGPGGSGIGNGTGIGNGDGNGNGTGNGIGGIGDGVGDGSGRTYFTEPVSKCGGKSHSSHGQGSTQVPINYGSSPGTVHILFDAYAIPDELFVRCGGQTVASTNGLVHAKHELQFEYHPFGTGPHANTCYVTVAASENENTKWQFGTSCPGELYEEQQ